MDVSYFPNPPGRVCGISLIDKNLAALISNRKPAIPRGVKLATEAAKPVSSLLANLDYGSIQKGRQLKGFGPHASNELKKKEIKKKGNSIKL